jgi:hypothetical protein
MTKSNFPKKFKENRLKIFEIDVSLRISEKSISLIGNYWKVKIDLCNSRNNAIINWVLREKSDYPQPPLIAALFQISDNLKFDFLSHFSIFFVKISVWDSNWGEFWYCCLRFGWKCREYLRRRVGDLTSTQSIMSFIKEEVSIIYERFVSIMTMIVNFCLWKIVEIITDQIIRSLPKTLNHSFSYHVMIFC